MFGQYSDSIVRSSSSVRPMLAKVIVSNSGRVKQVLAGWKPDFVSLLVVGIQFRTVYEEH